MPSGCYQLLNIKLKMQVVTVGNNIKPVKERAEHTLLLFLGPAEM